MLTFDLYVAHRALTPGTNPRCAANSISFCLFGMKGISFCLFALKGGLPIGVVLAAAAYHNFPLEVRRIVVDAVLQFCYQ